MPLRLPISVLLQCARSAIIGGSMRCSLPRSRCGIYAISVRHHFTYPSPRKLTDLLKVESVAALNTDELTHVWLNAPAATASSSLIVHSVMNGDSGRKVLATAKRVPLFIIPAFTKLYTSDGYHQSLQSDISYETLLLNWQDNHCLFTSLAEYRLKQSAAQPFAIITFYADRVDEQNVCLVRSEILHTGVSRQHCHEWVELIRRLYDPSDVRAAKFINEFANKSPQFDMNKFVQYCRILALDQLDTSRAD